MKKLLLIAAVLALSSTAKGSSDAGMESFYTQIQNLLITKTQQDKAIACDQNNIDFDANHCKMLKLKLVVLSYERGEESSVNLDIIDNREQQASESQFQEYTEIKTMSIIGGTIIIDPDTN